jgi:hypothetical protein
MKKLTCVSWFLGSPNLYVLTEMKLFLEGFGIGRIRGPLGESALAQSWLESFSFKFNYYNSLLIKDTYSFLTILYHFCY